MPKIISECLKNTDSANKLFCEEVSFNKYELIKITIFILFKIISLQRVITICHGLVTPNFTHINYMNIK